MEWSAVHCSAVECSAVQCPPCPAPPCLALPPPCPPPRCQRCRPGARTGGSASTTCSPHTCGGARGAGERRHAHCMLGGILRLSPQCSEPSHRALLCPLAAAKLVPVGHAVGCWRSEPSRCLYSLPLLAPPAATSHTHAHVHAPTGRHSSGPDEKLKTSEPWSTSTISPEAEGVGRQRRPLAPLLALLHQWRRALRHLPGPVAQAAARPRRPPPALCRQ